MNHTNNNNSKPHGLMLFFQEYINKILFTILKFLLYDRLRPKHIQFLLFFLFILFCYFLLHLFFSSFLQLFYFGNISSRHKNSTKLNLNYLKRQHAVSNVLFSLLPALNKFKHIFLLHFIFISH